MIGSGRAARTGWLRRLVVPVLGLLVVTGCSASIQDVTLPGGAASDKVFGSAPTRTFTVVFNDALDLVPQSAVHVDDVSVGDVQEVTLARGKAEVRIRVLDSVAVPANARGVLRQTSLLGEKFVSLEVAPGQAPEGRLADGALIPASETAEELQLEDVFGALSALLNGGGVDQLNTISVELSKTLTGRETELRNLLKQLTIFTTTLDQRRGEIVRALDSLDRLSATLVRQRQTITTALDKIAPGLKVLDASREDLVALLQALDRLGDVAVRVQNKTREDTVADLRALEPTLARLQQAGDDIIGSLQLLVTFPFGDNALKAIFSDYTGLKATLNLDLRPGSAANPLGPNGVCAAVPPGTQPDLCPVTGAVNGVVGGVVGGVGGLPGVGPSSSASPAATAPRASAGRRGQPSPAPSAVAAAPGGSAGVDPLGGISDGLGQILGGPLR